MYTQQSTTGMWSQTVLWFFLFVFFLLQIQLSPHYISNDVKCVLPLSLLLFFCFFWQNGEKYQPILAGIYICAHFVPSVFHFLSLLNVHCERSELKFTALHGMYVYLVEFSRVRGWLYDFGTEATTKFSTGGGGLKGGWLVWVMHIHSVLKYGVCRIP